MHGQNNFRIFVAKSLFMKKLLLFSIFLFSTICAVAENAGEVKPALSATTQGMEISVYFFSDDIVRVVKAPQGHGNLTSSLVVLMKPGATELSKPQENGSIRSVSSKSLTVSLNTTTGKVSFYDKSGKQLLTEKDYGTQFTPRMDGKDKSYWVRQAFMLDTNEPIYGLGQQQTGKMNQRGQRLELMQRNEHICIPLFQSVKGYGVYWDNYSPTIFEDNQQETSFSSEAGNCSDYYFLYGGNMDGVVAKTRQLTGDVPMMPLWSAGYLQCRAAYESTDEVREVVHRYRKERIPLDVIIQDWHYWGENDNWNSMSFDVPQYKDAQAMIDDVHKNNVKFMISVWPSFGKNTAQYKEFDANNMLYHGVVTWPNDGAEIYDAFNPKARDIYWKYLKHLYDMGTDAWWTDATEPEQYEERESDFNVPTYLGTFRRVRNAYPLMTNMGVYQHLRQASNTRNFIMTRSGYLGMQHYGAATWSGDVSGCWEDFKKQIPAGINYTLTGLPYWNTDIGGWNPWQYPKGLKDPAYREMHVRWFQFGAFSPIMRSHNLGVPVELYQFGGPGDLAYDVQLQYIKIRYRLLPYIYSTMGDVTLHNGSIMRGLPMDFPQDTKTYDLDSEFLFGKSMLVAPVTDSLYTARTDHGTEVNLKDVKTWSVYLPEGSDWYDIWTSEKLSGGQTVNREVPMDIMPVYVKAGTILPLGPDMQYTGEKKWSDLEIRIYPGKDGKFVLYEDETDNYNYENGKYTEIPFTWNDAKRTLTIGKREGAFNGMLKNRKFHITICNKQNAHGFSPSKATKSVSYSGKQSVIKF